MFSGSVFSVSTQIAVINNNINDDESPGAPNRQPEAPGPLTDKQGASEPLTDNQRTPGLLADN